MKGKYNSGVHATLLAVVGGYILYLAWMLFEKYRDNTGEMPPILNIIAIVVFALGGFGTLFYAWNTYRKGKKENAAEEGKEDQDKK